MKLLVALLIGVVLYMVFAIMPKEIERPDARSIAAGIWLVVYLLFMLAMSYFGSARGAAANGGKGLVHYPMDLVAVVVASLVLIGVGRADCTRGWPTRPSGGGDRSWRLSLPLIGAKGPVACATGPLRCARHRRNARGVCLRCPIIGKEPPLLRGHGSQSQNRWWNKSLTAAHNGNDRDNE